jgi:glycosyltransferase involved in cell wall biosynthesis
VIVQLQQQFSNIVFIDQINKGVSLARNAGIDKATGKYLLFIDPDDYVVPNSFAKAIKAADEQEAEVAFLGFTFLQEDGSVKNELFFTQFKNQLFSGTEGYYNARRNVTLDPDRTVAILFKRSFLNSNNIRYIANIPYLEDGELIARICCLANRCIFEGSPFYLRTTRPGSATNSTLFYLDKSINGFVKAAINLKQFSLNNMLSQQQREFMNQPLSKFVLLAIESSAQIHNWKKLFEVKSQLAKNGLKNLDLTGVLHPYSVYAKLYNISPILFVVYLNYKKVLLSLSLKFKRS